MKKIGIYKITNPSGRIYIGQSIDILKRFAAYKRLHCNHQKKLLASLKKYGYNKHKFEILHICSQEELDIMEKYYVDLYNTFNNKKDMNIRDGGGNKGKLSEEHKRKISESLKGKKHSPERIEKNRLSQIGKKLSEEHKLKIKLNNKKPNLGKKASSETLLKMSLAHKGKGRNKGYRHTEETKLKLKMLNLGDKNPNFGISKNQETKEKIKNSVTLWWQKRKENEKSKSS